MALDLIELFGGVSGWLLDDSQSKGISRIAKRGWLFSVVAIIITAVMTNIVGSLAGYLDVPGDTKTIFIWAIISVIAITVMATVVALIASIIQKLGSIIDRGTGNKNVHLD